MSEQVPKELKTVDLAPLCWAAVPKGIKQQERCTFFDLSKGKEDPPFRHLVIAPDRIEGFEEHYLVVYFDGDGNWVTQSAFETVEEALRHGEFAFQIAEQDWKWVVNPKRDEE